MAKPTPTFADRKPSVLIEVFIPITWPFLSASGPPELPGLIGASVCIMATPAHSALMGPAISQPYEGSTRPIALTIPDVTV